MMDLEQRVSNLEKEVADLKQQLKDQPKCIRIPLSVIKFNDLYYDIKRLNTEDLNALVDHIEKDMEKRLAITFSFDQST